jgi:hypothetical protein
MASQFTYSIAAGTLNGAVSANKLDREIRASSAVAIELVGLTTQGDALTIDFKSDLEAGEVSALGALIEAHDGVPIPSRARVDIRSDGALRVVQEPSNKDNLLQVKGFAATIASPSAPEEVPTQTNCDITPDVPYDIQGVQGLWVIGDRQHADDYVKFAVVFPTGASQEDWESLTATAWPFSPLTEAPVDVELKLFADNVYIPAGGLAPVVADGTQTIAPPLVMRLSYFAHEVSPTTPLLMRGNLRWWRFQT